MPVPTFSVVVVVAAGNDSTNLDITGPGWPAGFAGTYDNVVAVGASTNSDTHAHFSNTGSIVGIHAPGWAILSTLPGSTEGIQYGTSMASPYVAAGAAAVISSGHASDPASVIARLKATADNLGWGIRIDLAQAVGYEAMPLPAEDQVEVRHVLVMYPGLKELEKQGQDIRAWIKEQVKAATIEVLEPGLGNLVPPENRAQSR